MTKIDIISGFLGAGKTTLIKKLLQDSFQNEQVVLIENEFGEIGIDGGFLKESGIEIKEMSSGCICCSLVGDFYTSLKEVIDTYHPDRIVIEPSGVGKLSDVISAVSKVTGENVLLNSYTTVADVTKCKIYLKNFGEFYKNQLEYAGAIILSRTDKVSPEKAEKCLELIRTVNEKAPVVTTPINQLSGEQLLSVIEGVPTLEEEMLKEEEICPVCGHHHDHEHEHHHSDDCCHDHEHHHEHEHDHHEHDCCHDHDHEHDHNCCHDHEHHHEHDCCHDHHHHADEVFQSFGKETVRPFSEEEISQILSALSDEETYGTILRAKGYFASKDGGEFIHFDMVPEETEIRRGPADYTGRFCVIGAGLKEDAIHALFFQNK